MHGGSSGGNQAADLTNPVVVQLAHLDRGPGVEVLEPGADLVQPGDVSSDVVRAFPAFLEDDRDHGLGQQRIRPRSDRQMDVRDLGRLRRPRVDDHEYLVGILGEAFQKSAGLRHLVAHHAVPSQGQQHVGVVVVGDQELVAGGLLPGPEQAGELLGQGRIVILRAETPQQRPAEESFQVGPLATAAHVGVRARPMGIQDRPELLRDLVDGLIPGDPLEVVPNPLQRMEEPLAVVLVVVYVPSLAADVALAAKVLLARPNLDHPVVLYLDLEPAVLGAQHTRGLQPFRHLALLRLDTKGRR